MDHLFMCLTAWLAPAICFTAEEAWLTRFPSADDSIHLRVFPDVPSQWRDESLAERWQILRDVRRVVTGALEIERAEKRIGSSLQAHPVVYLSATALAAFDQVAKGGIEAADLFITSGATLSLDAAPDDAFRLEDVVDAAVVPARAPGEKCGRCWRVLDEVGKGEPDDLCDRCAGVVSALDG